MNRILSLLSMVGILCFIPRVHAEGESADSDESKAVYEMGFQLGNLLPNQIPGVTEIIGLGGVLAAARVAPLTYLEGGLISGNGSGVQWKNLHLDLRIDIPVENLVGFAYFGGDSDYYKGTDSATHLYFGGHAGGGIQLAITDMLWFRGDMKFSISPGTSLYIGAGFTFRFGG